MANKHDNAKKLSQIIMLKKSKIIYGNEKYFGLALTLEFYTNYIKYIEKKLLICNN